jgi:hypothetical protein
MVVAVQQPTRKKRDIFDVVLTGLQAASAFTNIQRGQAELERIPEVQARQKRAEEIQLAQTFEPAAEGTRGAIQLPGKEGLFLPRGEAAKARKVEREAAKTDREIEKQQREKANKKFQQLSQVENNLKKNKDFQKASAKILSSQEIIDLGNDAIKNNSQQSFSAMQSIIAGNILTGVLTDADLERFGGEQSVAAKLERFATKAVGDVRTEDVEDLMQIARVANDSGIRTVDTLRNDAITSSLKKFKIAGIEDISREELEEIMDVNALLEAAAVQFPERTKKRSRENDSPLFDFFNSSRNRESQVVPPQRTVEDDVSEFRSLIGQ